MKNLKFLVIALALLIGIAGCKKEEKAVVDNNSIVGTWVSASRLQHEYLDGILMNTPKAQDITEEYTLEFKSDGSWHSIDRTGNYKGTYTLTENGGVLNAKFLDEELGEVNEKYEIRVLNSIELVYYIEHIRTVDGKVNKGTTLTTFKRR
jgi:hypothetical protein